MTLAQPGFAYTVAVYLAVIGVLVFVHEFGHYFVARLCGVRAEAFAIGFGRELAGWTDRQGTRWRLGWLPFGGYVKFAGDADASSRPAADIEATPAAERSGLFHFAPLWKKAAITAAGPATNFLFAILIYAAFFALFGKVVMPAVVDQVQPGSPAAIAGLRHGDRIVSVDDEPTPQFRDLQDRTAINVGEPMRLGIVRDGVARTVAVTPRLVEERDPFGNRAKIRRIGVKPVLQQAVVAVPVLQLVPTAMHQVATVVRAQIAGIGQIVTGKRSIKEMGGPVKMAQMTGQVAALGWLSLVEFVAFISINLGFINLLPVPMLDGGHLFLYALQALRRRPLGARVQELAFLSGFAVLVSLMVVLTWNDLGAIGVWKHLTGLLG